jgi:hypothetical protein
MFILLAPAVTLAQTTPAVTKLTVKGYPGQAPVIQANGKSYVEIESLARVTNGTLSFQGNQVILTLPAGGAVPAAAPPEGLSRDFLRAVIAEMSAIENWRAALVNAIQNNNPFAQDTADGYRRAADSRLSLAATTVTTEPDKNLLPLLRSEFTNMQTLSDRYVAMHKNQTYVPPDSLDNEPLNQQIQNCAHGLSSLSAGGPFVDVAACH